MYELYLSMTDVCVADNFLMKTSELGQPSMSNTMSGYEAIHSLRDELGPAKYYAK